MGIVRFEGRAVLGWGALLLGAGPFLLLWLLVEAWPPMARLDERVADGLNAAVSGSGVVVSALSAVTDLGGTGTAVLLMTLATVFLLIRRRRRLATFVVTTGLGLAALGPATKAIVDRARPMVDVPIVQTPSNASFPSGHSMTAVVVYGALLLVALPSVRRRVRPWLIAGAVLVMVAVGLTRLALGVHFVSDVLAGWALGVGWLAITGGAFRAWQHDLDQESDEPLDPLDGAPGEVARPTTGAGSALPGWQSAGRPLLVAAGTLFAGFTGLGLLVTAVLGQGWLASADRGVVRWLLERRTSELTTVLDTVGMVSGTPGFIAATLTMVVVGRAFTATWRPALFAVVAVIGELALYLATSQVVSRARPAIADLTAGLPTAASFPSGHAAGAAVLYGAVAALVVVYTRPRRRWLILSLPLLTALAVSVSRLYVAAHYPTDVLAGMLLGSLWVLACARYLLPDPDAEPSLAGEVRAAAVGDELDP
ncbi:phosphatase PAP2 family protein [Salsipaludibacter albus]|uniref:phosphatase PAP2 family protein n=1 Tax=Salsipaludibacter albus TaxID=2849650 RepID=UPI001EE3E773|nr:phosphatase PAP2 family protein [Salsipaludibacter albus]MBY5163711.1 phosphatase PAP2 family protein [Salsipaludibacter albus]